METPAALAVSTWWARGAWLCRGVLERGAVLLAAP